MFAQDRHTRKTGRASEQNPNVEDEREHRRDGIGPAQFDAVEEPANLQRKRLSGLCGTAPVPVSAPKVTKRLFAAHALVAGHDHR